MHKLQHLCLLSLLALSASAFATRTTPPPPKSIQNKHLGHISSPVYAQKKDTETPLKIAPPRLKVEAENAYQIADAGAVTPEPGKTGAAPAKRPRPSGEGQAPDNLEEVRVTGARVSRSATATRTDTPILETPMSIQVVPERVIEDQAVIRLRDVYRNISGVQSSFTGFNVNSAEGPIIRGFGDSYIYRNGLRSAAGFAPVELANVERVEVLKGPASMLFGLAEPGGILNIVTKQPTEESFATLSQEFGSFERYRTTIDANTPLSDDNSLLGRINFAYTSDNTFRDHAGIDRFFIAPALTWRPGADTELIFEASYSHEKHPFDHGLSFTTGGEPAAEISTFLGEPDSRSEREEFFVSYFLTYFLTHDANESLTFRNFTSFQYTENRLKSFRHFSPLGPVDNTVNRSFTGEVRESTAIQALADVSYDFDLGASKHQVLVGVDARLEPSFGNGASSTGARSSGPFPINGVNPRHGLVGEISENAPLDFERETTWVGIYIQDQMSLFDERIHVLIGGRYDYIDQFVDFDTPSFQLVVFQSDKA